MPRNDQPDGIAEGHKVTLRPVTRKDLPALYRWMQNEHLLKAINRSKKTTWNSHLLWYKGLRTDKGQVVFSIEHAKSGELLGQCGLRNIDRANQKAELWIYLGNSGRRGRGFGTEAVRSLLNYAFGKEDLNRIYIYVLDFNLKARCFYQSLGFKQEGLFSQNVMSNGTFHDTVHMAILKKDYVKATNRIS